MQLSNRERQKKLKKGTIEKTVFRGGRGKTMMKIKWRKGQRYG